jgi:hypothetical protein
MGRYLVASVLQARPVAFLPYLRAEPNIGQPWQISNFPSVTVTRASVSAANVVIEVIAGMMDMMVIEGRQDQQDRQDRQDRQEPLERLQHT